MAIHQIAQVSSEADRLFDDAAAQNIHGESAAVKRFESSPELVGGDVVFTNDEVVAAKGR